MIRRERRATRTVAAGFALAFALNLFLVVSPSTPSSPAIAASCATNADSPVTPEESWGQQRMGAERAWSRTTGKVIVAVVDTGVSANTTSLQGAVLPGSDLSGGAGNVDCFGRGTFIASLIASRPVEGTEFVGAAPGATILPIRVTNDPGEFDLDKNLPGPLAAAIAASVTAGARVIAIPLTTSVDDTGLRAAVRAALRENVLIIASAARPDEGAAFPAQLDGVLSVAPLSPTGGTDPSKLGAAPDLASPSSELLGAVPDGSGHIHGGDDGVAVGYVAAAAALVMEEYPDMSAQQVFDRLIETADSSGAASASETGRDPSIGYGVVNPVAAVTRLEISETSVATPAAVPALVLPPKPDGRPVDLALAVAIAALAAAVLVIGPTIGVVLVQRKRIAE